MMRLWSSVMQLARAASIAWGGHAEQSIALRGEPVIETWIHFSEWPQGKNGRQPLPTRQYANQFDPGKVPFGPAAVGEVRVHRVRHLFARARRRALQDFGIVVVQPLDAPIAIQRLNPRARIQRQRLQWPSV